MNTDAISVGRKTKSVVEELADDRGIGKAETIQEAIALLKYLSERQRQGAHLLLIEKDGTQRQIVVTDGGEAADG